MTDKTGFLIAGAAEIKKYEPHKLYSLADMIRFLPAELHCLLASLSYAGDAENVRRWVFPESDITQLIRVLGALGKYASAWELHATQSHIAGLRGYLLQFIPPAPSADILDLVVNDNY